MTGRDIARSALGLLDTGASLLIGLNLHPAVTLAATAVDGATHVVLGILDNLDKQDAGLAELKEVLLKSVSVIDDQLAIADRARAAADAKIEAAAPDAGVTTVPPTT